LISGKSYADFLPGEDSLGLLIFSRGKAISNGGELDEFGYCSAAMLRDLNDDEEEGVLAGEILF
jgi:hypothetical protein